MDDFTQVLERLARIETKLDHVSEKFNSHDTQIGDHESRIRELEKTAPDPDLADRVAQLEKVKWLFAGAAAVLGGAAGQIGNFFG